MKQRGLIAVAALVVGIGGVLAGRAVLGNTVQLADPAVIEALAAQGDSLALAQAAWVRCRAGADKASCYQQFFVRLAEQGQVSVALGALAALARKDRSVESDGHVYTHLVGITAFRPGSDVGPIFAQCTPLFQSGCYHGVIQTYLTAESGVDSAKVADLCDKVDGGVRHGFLRFQCVHGLGHGLEMIWNWELPKALAGCDWLTDGWDRESCYGGAFMENAVAAQPSHAPADLLAERGDGAGGGGNDGHEAHGGGHGHGGLDLTKVTFKLRDTTELHYPCTIVGDRYLVSCYQLQGGVILRMLNWDFKAAAAECDEAPEPWRHHCYLSIGTSAAGYTMLDARRSIRHCDVGDPGYRPWCIVGAVKNFVDVTSDPEDGLDFCKLVPSGPNRRQCYVAVGEELRVLFPGDAPTRTGWCARAPEGDVADCNFGAMVIAVAPPGLPLIPGQVGAATPRR